MLVADLKRPIRRGHASTLDAGELPGRGAPAGSQRIKPQSEFTGKISLHFSHSSHWRSHRVFGTLPCSRGPQRFPGLSVKTARRFYFSPHELKATARTPTHRASGRREDQSEWEKCVRQRSGQTGAVGRVPSTQQPDRDQRAIQRSRGRTWRENLRSACKRIQGLERSSEKRRNQLASARSFQRCPALVIPRFSRE